MATLGQIPQVMHRVGPWRFAVRVWQRVQEDQVLVWACALAYSWLFAIFPFLIFLLTLIPYLPSWVREHATTVIDRSIKEAFPSEGANTILGNISEVIANINGTINNAHGGLLSLGLAITLFSASGGMSMTMYALDRCYDIRAGRPFYRQRPLAMMLTCVVIVMIVAVLVLLPIGSIAIDMFPEMHRNALPIHILRFSLSLILMFGVMAIVYYYGPAVRQPFHFISPGAVFSIVVWLLLGMVVRAYINDFSHYDKTYGAVGGVAILLFVLYIDAVVLLIGAEINSEIDLIALGLPRGVRVLIPAGDPSRPGDSDLPPAVARPAEK
jgi:membrane protein